MAKFGWTLATLGVLAGVGMTTGEEEPAPLPTVTYTLPERDEPQAQVRNVAYTNDQATGESIADMAREVWADMKTTFITEYRKARSVQEQRRAQIDEWAEQHQRNVPRIVPEKPAPQGQESRPAERKAPARQEPKTPPEGTNVPGICTVYQGKVTVYACAPERSPNRGTLNRGVVEEDSSATYSDGSWFDAEDSIFGVKLW